MQDKAVTEWQILFTMTSGKEDFYTEDESEYNEMFQDLIDNDELDTVEQCIRKDYVWDEETEDWNEDWVEILYDSESYDDYVDNKRVSEDIEIKEERYNIFTVSEDEPNVYNSHKVDTVDSIEQAEDRVAEIQAETGNSAYYDIVDEWWEENAERVIKYVGEETGEVLADLLYDGDIDVYMQSSSKQIALDLYIQLGKEETERLVNEFFNKELEETAAFKKHPSIKTYSITDGGWKNNADTVYGQLKDGRYFMYVPEMETLDIYNEPVDELLDTLYYDTKHGEELPEEEYQKRIKDFNDKHHIESITGGELYDELHKLYFDEELEEAKSVNSDSLKQAVEKVVLKYMTGPNCGFDEDEAKDYFTVEIQDGGKETLVEVRVELDYESIIDLTEMLDKVIKKYDNNSYFDMVSSGILAAVIERPLGKKTESIVRCDKCGKQIDLDYNSEEYIFDEETNGGMCIDCAGHYKIVDKKLVLTDEILQDYPMPEGEIVFDEEIQILEPTDFEDDRVRVIIADNDTIYEVNSYSIGKHCGYSAASFQVFKDEVDGIEDLINKTFSYNSPFADYGSSCAGYDYPDREEPLFVKKEENKKEVCEMEEKIRPEKTEFGFDYESYEEIMTPLETVKADTTKSYTIARVCEGDLFAELHWDGKAPYVEFSWRISQDAFDGTFTYDVEWFNLDMSEEDILKNLNKEFNEYFGDDRVVESKELKTEDSNNESVDATQVVDVVDTDYELLDAIKKELYAYCKQQGLDLEKLRKQGVQLETLADTIDKVVGDMVSKAAIEYMDRVGYDIMWDFEINDNDIKIIYNKI